MATSTLITASLMDAINKHPKGFTMDVQTGKVIDHGIAVGGYHQDHGFTEPNWIHYNYGVAVPFEVLQEQVEEWLDIIQKTGFIGGWENKAGITLDIVEVYPCLIHSGRIVDGSPILEGKRLNQHSVGWLCPSFAGGYKEVTI